MGARGTARPAPAGGVVRHERDHPTRGTYGPKAQALT